MLSRRLLSKMRQMIRFALEEDNPSDQDQPRGWLKALQSGKTQGMNKISNYAIRYSTDERRAGWKYILPLNKLIVAFDILE